MEYKTEDIFYLLNCLLSIYAFIIMNNNKKKIGKIFKDAGNILNKGKYFSEPKRYHSVEDKENDKEYDFYPKSEGREPLKYKNNDKRFDYDLDSEESISDFEIIDLE